VYLLDSHKNYDYDPGSVPSTFLSSIAPTDTGGIDHDKTDIVNALIAAMKSQDNSCFKSGAKDHSAY
jgi:hypothetical protein